MACANSSNLLGGKAGRLELNNDTNMRTSLILLLFISYFSFILSAEPVVSHF